MCSTDRDHEAYRKSAHGIAAAQVQRTTSSTPSKELAVVGVGQGTI